MALGSVQSKLSCVFEIAVLSEPSEKRSYQPYKVVATNKLRQAAVNHDIFNGHPSEKLDGTCVLISPFQGKPWLWARYDRKPKKQAEKKFRAYQSRRNKGGTNDNIEEIYPWDVTKDFKDVPDSWIPASGVEIIEGQAQSDRNGHIPGWVPIDPKNRQHCWHLSAVHLEKSLALILREDSESDLEIDAVPLKDLEGHTAELIGTNINANAYKIGSKEYALHFLVIHGSIPSREPPPLGLEMVSTWLTNSPSGRVEGVVWHCPDQTLFKLHRHHVGLPWPIETPLLSTKPVKVIVNVSKYDLSQSNDTKRPQKDLFWLMGTLTGTKYDCFSALTDRLCQLN